MKFGINPLQYYDQGDGTLDWDAGPGEDVMYRELKQAGFHAVATDLRHEWNPASYVADLGRHSLRPAPGYFSAPLADENGTGDALVRFSGIAERSVAVGMSDIIVASQVTESLRARATRQAQEPVDGSLVRVVSRNLEALGRVASERGARIALHQHVGSAIESPALVEAVLDTTDSDLVGLCPDTGHLAWGGCDDVRGFLQAWHARVRLLHLKDIAMETKNRGVSEGWDYSKFVTARLWRELGDGDLDLAGILTDFADDDIWCVVEVDSPARPTARESIEACGAFLQAQGFDLTSV